MRRGICSEDQAVFEVALWRWWPSLFPEYVVSMAAPAAFAAIEQVMQVAGVRFVARAAADAVDGSLRYRAIRVRLGGGMHDS